MADAASQGADAPSATEALVAATLARYTAPAAATPCASALLTGALVAACKGVEHRDAQRLARVVCATATGGSLPAPGDSGCYDAASLAFLTAARARLGGDAWCHPENGRAAVEACAAAAWAAGLGARAGWSEMVAAFAAGVEAQQWLVSVLRQDRGCEALDLPSLTAVVGAGCTAGLLGGLAPHRLAQAIGISASQTVGTPLLDTTPAGVLHAARPAANGVLAAQLAQVGYTGPARVLEVHRGLFAVLARGRVGTRPSPGEVDHLAALSPFSAPGSTPDDPRGQQLRRIAALHRLSDQLRTRFGAPDAVQAAVVAASEEVRACP